MFDRLNFAIGSVCGAVAVIVVALVALKGCDMTTDRYTQRYRECVSVGGIWVPTGQNNNAVCISPSRNP